MSDFRLKVFYSVAKNLSFTKASQELFVSQPAVTKHIHELESMYNIRLFNRINNKISLTDAGRIMMEHCERILTDYRKLEYDMHMLNNKYAGELRLGASTTISQYILPPILAKFIERYPNIKVSLIDSNSRNIETLVKENTIDLGMVEGVFHAPNLKYESFLCDELVPVIHKEAMPEDITELSIEKFIATPLVLRERGSGTLDAIETTLAEAGLKLSSLNIMMHLGSTESIKSFLRYSNCMGIVSIASVTKELSENILRVVELKGLNFSRHFCFVTAQGQEIEAAQLFMRYMYKCLGKKE